MSRTTAGVGQTALGRVTESSGRGDDIGRISGEVRERSFTATICRSLPPPAEGQWLLQLQDSVQSACVLVVTGE